MFMEAKKSFIEASTSSSLDKLVQEIDPCMFTTFLETFMKLLCNSKAMMGLQELMIRCVGTAPGELCIVRKLGKHMKRIGREMRLMRKLGNMKWIK